MNWYCKLAKTIGRHYTMLLWGNWCNGLNYYSIDIAITGLDWWTSMPDS